ncbi:MAG: exonuclease domain-containing protein [Acidimicrobiia bacterium]
MSADWRSVRYAALDFETTGLDPGRDRVISVGLVPVMAGRVDLAGSLEFVVDPGVRPGAESIRIHRMLPSDVGSGRSPAEVAPMLASALGEDPIVVWTAWVESAFLPTVCGGSGRRWGRRMVDVRHLTVRFDERTGCRPSPARTDELGDTARRFGVPPELSHDALADAFVTAQLFVIVATKLAALEPLTVTALRAYGARSDGRRRR